MSIIFLDSKGMEIKNPKLNDHHKNGVRLISSDITYSHAKPRTVSSSQSPGTGKCFMTLVAEYQNANPGSTKTEAMRALARSNPSAHLAFLRQHNPGKTLMEGGASHG